MIRFIFGNPSVESLRKEAKAWLKALRAHDNAALARLRKTLPDAPATPSLRDVQLALARERGHAGWSALKAAIASQGNRQSLVDELLRQMIFHGNPADGARLLARHPELAAHDFFTAVATGRLDLVQQALAAAPDLATRAGGPLGWEPLLYLAYSRLPGHDHDAMAIARLLLDHGANANAQWRDDWGNPFTVLTGVAGQGEGVKPQHPQARELAALLLERGAEPFDTQLLYNNSIVDDSLWWLDLLWKACEARDLLHRWREVPPAPPSGQQPLNQLDYLLGNAVTHLNPRRAEWLMNHGASPDAIHAYTGKPLLELAQLRGAEEMVRVLRRRGAREVELDAEAQFQIACRRGDFSGAAAIVGDSPELAGRAAPLMTAAATGRIDLIDKLLQLGTPVDIRDSEGSRALQAAVFHDARDAVRHLLARGAKVDIPTRHYGGAMGTAAFRGHVDCALLLAPHSRDVHNMTTLGLKARLEELFKAEPALANLVHFRRGDTPLFWLPQEEPAALEMARFLLVHGADMRKRNKEGDTAGELARRRGQEALARLLGA